MRGKIRAILAAALALSAGFAPARAWACGACVSPPGPSPIVQDAERIFFHRDPITKKSTVWVEIKYNGPANDFGWVVPMPKVPKIGVGSSYLFDRLDQVTAPRFRTDISFVSEGCDDFNSSRSSSFGCGGSSTNSGSADLAFPTSAKGGPDDPNGVKIIQSSQVGPYDTVTLKAGDGKALLDWLNTNKFATPAAALPIIDAHAKNGDVFVAFKLKADESSPNIVPVTFEMDDADPCVPLRLTSVASVENLAVVVYLAGPGRAIPKNHMHVAVNPLRLNWSLASSNYREVLAAAIDEAAGRAFATEFSGPAKDLKVSDDLKSATGQSLAFFSVPIDNTDSGFGEGLLFGKVPTAADDFAGVKTRSELAAVLMTSTLPLTSDTVTLIRNYLSDSHGTWPVEKLRVNLVEARKTGVWFDASGKEPYLGAALAKDLTDKFLTPMLHVQELLNNAKTLTRLHLRISPAEMTRDPVFAFNSELPSVSPLHIADMHPVCRDGGFNQDAMRLHLPELDRSYVIDGNAGQFMSQPTANNAKDARFVAAPAAIRVELLDEKGAAQPVAESDIAVVDSAIAGALPGKAQLATPLALAAMTKVRWTPPPSDGTIIAKRAETAAQTDTMSCAQSGVGAARNSLAVLFGLTALVVWVRRSRHV